MSYNPPSPDCAFCPRLAGFREANRIQYPGFFNAPVPSFGSLDAEVLVVGLAPGLKGANRTGRPFTGDYAGLVLYSALKRYGFAEGEYDPEKVRGIRGQGSGVGVPDSSLSPDPRHLIPGTDGFHLINCRITNAVRCVPQQNKPEPSEIRQCNSFLSAEIKAMPNLKIIIILGLIAHKAVLMALGLKQSAFTFGHGAEHHLQLATRSLQLLNTYHCSRYNINTGRLTQAMFDDVVNKARVLAAY
jgi:uracil-DNA glycosylase family 4